MFKFFKKLVDYNEKEISRLTKMVESINQKEDDVRSFGDEDFGKKTEEFKELIKKEKKGLDDILPEAYALVREASRRVLGMRHFDVQLLAAIAMHEGKVVEQRTGEGKTLTATAALYLNALSGKGVHLVTVNDYLARRDAGWMAKVYAFLGLSTSVIISNSSLIYDPEFVDSGTDDWRLMHLRPISRKEAYEADITYGINSEFGFDFLRDNMVSKPNDMVQRGFNFAIVDEADSVLIDEARTPHIISAPYADDVSRYYDYARIVKKLSKDEDFVIDEKLKTAHLTDQGIEKVEKATGVDNIYAEDFDTLFYLEAAVKAETLFQKDKDYIVKDGEVIIVDEFTGRLLEGRRFSEGLHQAIEAKENVSIKQESRTLATVSLQNYFRGYDKLAGMTGTAATEAEEFNKIYKANVIVVPTHMPMVRKDHSDMIYKTEKGKFEAVARDIAERYKEGRPVLIGTTSIEKNEKLSALLKKKNIPHELLNAKNHSKEAQIIAEAGKKSAVTVATNMAGRGVDIVLGGQQPNENDYKGNKDKYEKALREWQSSHDDVVEKGGLYVIGTERHESRRIDNQLRGRAGRQGDPGDTVFYVSLEDDLMRIFGGDRISQLMTMFNLPEDTPLSHSMVSKAIEQSQIKVEGHNFDMRKHLVEYDDVINKQRDIVYAERRKILKMPEEDKKKFEDTIFDSIEDVIKSMATSYFTLAENLSEEERENIIKDFNIMLSVQESRIEDYLEEEDQEKFELFLLNEAKKKFNSRKEQVTDDVWFSVVRSIYLSVYDKFWTQHLTAIADLREGINLRGYAHLNPLNEYKNEAYTMFEKLLNDIHYEAVRKIMRVQVDSAENLVEKKEDKKQDMVFKSASSTDPYSSGEKDYSQQTGSTSQSVGRQKKLGRNDLCWCGSGKKYKKCHYPN